MQRVSRPTRRVRRRRGPAGGSGRRTPPGCEHRHDLDPCSPKLRLYQGKRLRSRPQPRRSSRSATRAAARRRRRSRLLLCGSQLARAGGGPPPVDSDTRSSSARSSGSGPGARRCRVRERRDRSRPISVGRARCGRSRTRARGARACCEAPGARSVRAGREVLEAGAYGRDQAHPGQPTNGRDDRWWNAHGDVELAAPQLLAGIGRRPRESDDEPLDVGWVRPPVAGVTAEDELPAALESLDEERAAPDGSTRPRIVDPVAPDLREVSNRGARAPGGCSRRSRASSRTSAEEPLARSCDRRHGHSGWGRGGHGLPEYRDGVSPAA